MFETSLYHCAIVHWINPNMLQVIKRTYDYVWNCLGIHVLEKVLYKISNKLWKTY